MTRMSNLPHTTKARSKGDRDGGMPARSRLAVDLQLPGAAGSGAETEQLFAADYWACFEATFGIATRRIGSASYLRASIKISLASLERCRSDHHE